MAHVARVPPVAADVAPPGRGGWFARLWPLLAVRRGLFALAFTAALVALLAQVAVPRVLMAAVDALDQPGAVRRWAAVLVGLAIVRAIGTLGQRSLLLRASYDLEADLRTLVFGHLGRLGAAALRRVPAGEVISRANSDVRAVQLYVTFGPIVALNVASGVLALVLMLGVSVPLTLAALAPMPVVVWASLRMRADLYPASWLVQARQAEVASLVEEDVTGVRVVRTMAAEQQRVTALARSARRLAWATGYQFEVRARDAPLIEHLPRVGLALVLAVGGWLVARGSATVGAILAFSSYVLLLQTPFRMIGAIVMMAQRAAAAGERILELLDTADEVAQAPDAVDPHPVRGHLVLRGVTFSHEGARAPVLAGLDLEVRPGQVVAVVGPSGAGKTTLIDLLTRQHDVDAGCICLDGRDIRSLALPGLRAAVGVVADDPYLFSGRVHDTIAYGRPDASREDVEAAAALAGADPFVRALDGGYDHVLGEGGRTLSGGQRQRLAIARTLLADPPMLVLDDATSAIDAGTEARIHAALGTVVGGRTTVIVAHRLSTIALADRVVLLDDGRVVADGTHEDLLDREPRYARLLARELVGGGVGP